MPPEHNHTDTVSTPLRCDTCHSTLETPIACGSCHSIFPVPDDISHFDRLGLRETFALDPADLERRFLALSRELHPDFFTTRAPDEQRLSLAHSASLNEAASVLRDAFQRAAYLLQLWAPQALEERDQQMPTGFLEEMLMLREEIDELLTTPASPERDTQIDAYRSELEERRAALVQDLAQAFQELEALPHDRRSAAPSVTNIRRTLNAARYILGTINALREAR